MATRKQIQEWAAKGKEAEKEVHTVLYHPRRNTKDPESPWRNNYVCFTNQGHGKRPVVIAGVTDSSEAKRFFCASRGVNPTAHHVHTQVYPFPIKEPNGEPHEDKAQDQLSVSELGLTEKIRDILLQNDLHTVDDVLAYDEEKGLTTLEGIGIPTRDQILKAIY